MWKRILVPHDFSPCADRAVTVAAGLAKVHGASVLLLHVSDLPPDVAPDALVLPPGVEMAVRVDEFAARGAMARLELIAEPLRQAGVAVTTLAVAGEVAEEILSAASEARADAMVVGTHGRTGLQHLLLGSVAEKLVRHATVPVVTVRSGGPESQPTREESFVEDELAG